MTLKGHLARVLHVNGKLISNELRRKFLYRACVEQLPRRAILHLLRRELVDPRWLANQMRQARSDELGKRLYDVASGLSSGHYEFADTFIPLIGFELRLNELQRAGYSFEPAPVAGPDQTVRHLAEFAPVQLPASGLSVSGEDQWLRGRLTVLHPRLHVTRVTELFRRRIHLK